MQRLLLVCPISSLATRKTRTPDLATHAPSHSRHTTATPSLSPWCPGPHSALICPPLAASPCLDPALTTGAKSTYLTSHARPTIPFFSDAFQGHIGSNFRLCTLQHIDWPKEAARGSMPAYRAFSYTVLRVLYTVLRVLRMTLYFAYWSLILNIMWYKSECVCNNRGLMPVSRGV